MEAGGQEGNTGPGYRRLTFEWQRGLILKNELTIRHVTNTFLIVIRDTLEYSCGSKGRRKKKKEKVGVGGKSGFEQRKKKRKTITGRRNVKKIEFGS